ncbi:MAG: HAD family hydrolase [Muribaculaceae bacterium]|nr:HAD family hydrolase [Muribaculaceae bacterium]
MSRATTLYVSDLDGTLLNQNSEVSERTAQILHKLIEEGVQFTVATARTPATVEPLTAAIGIQLPMIVMTGAAWWEPQGKRFTHAHTIPVETVKIIAEVCSRWGIHPFVYCVQDDDFIRVEHVETLSAEELKFVKARLNLPHKAFYLNDNVAPAEAYLVFACNEYEKLKQVNEAIHQAAPECRSTCYPDIFDHSIGYLEVFAPHISKAAAIKQLASEINADKIVVFGDNLNDLPMLSIADTAIAVGNAFPEVKEKADIVIENNTTDAVARWIQENYK